ncbi:MAG: hypothetical protein Q8Q18_00240 [bacterium]|nr:hypothetical protein [bacterium]
MAHTLEYKFSFIEGLESIVRSEIANKLGIADLYFEEESLYTMYRVPLSAVRALKSVARVYVVAKNAEFSPVYVNRHKSILGDIIKIILAEHNEKFLTFNISVAGKDSPEIHEISTYIASTFKLQESDSADLKIHIGKNRERWEIGAQISKRPLSLRGYRAEHMPGAMDATIAYALNSLCELERAETYLNPFCGSATLLLEAADEYTNLTSLIGFDDDKKILSFAYKNVGEAGMLSRITLKYGDVVKSPELGPADVITADLPFGMVISKDEDIARLYDAFVSYASHKLNPDGCLGVFTPKAELIENSLRNSQFKNVKKIPTKIITSVDAYLWPTIYICKFKN